MPTFSTDWFSYAIPNFTAIKQHLKTVDSSLEIGVFQGRSTCWQLENMLSDVGTITCIDPFIESDDTALSLSTLPEQSERERLFRTNISEVKKPNQTVEVMVSRSYPALAQLIVDKRQFDFIYVDGNHCAYSALTDACMCYGLLRSGGVMLFDDYLWDHEPDHLDRPKMSIDSFVNMFGKQVRLAFSNYQLAVIKL